MKIKEIVYNLLNRKRGEGRKKKKKKNLWHSMEWKGCLNRFFVICIPPFPLALFLLCTEKLLMLLLILQ